MRQDRYILAYRCGDGCLWLYPHDHCPLCERRLFPVRIRDDATLISHTVVRVNPTGLPIHLGIARTSTGATTLCVVHGAIRGNGRDRVRLVHRDGRYHALAAGSRLSEFYRHCP